MGKPGRGSGKEGTDICGYGPGILFCAVKKDVLNETRGLAIYRVLNIFQSREWRMCLPP